MPLSGADWVEKFPTSDKVADLASPFRENVMSFLDALHDTDNAHISIAATRRPPQRAYMMHYSWMIFKGKIAAEDVPAFKTTKDAPDAVDIQWSHTDLATKKPDAAASKKAAEAMVKAYQIGHLGVAPALNSMHIRGNAIDMNISWTEELTIENAKGKEVTIRSLPRDGTNAELIQVGASYKVIHLLAVNKDKPHWSSNGY